MSIIERDLSTEGTILVTLEFTGKDADNLRALASGTSKSPGEMAILCAGVGYLQLAAHSLMSGNSIETFLYPPSGD